MHTIIENFAPPALLRAVAATWPREDWPHWHRYQDSNSIKWASKDAHRLPDAARLVIAAMAQIDVSKFAPGVDVFPDLDLHGAGLNMIPPGGHLGLHLDGAVHPLTGWRRELNAVLFVDDVGGGALEFWNAPDGVIQAKIYPVRNRLVLFTTDSNSWHRVQVVPGPLPRRTISLFWWSTRPCESDRDHAEFSAST